MEEGGNPYFNQAQGTDVHNRNVNMTIIQFLNSMEGDNDISVTKFLNEMVTQSSNGDINMTIIEFLEQNDISVTKFLEFMDRHGVDFAHHAPAHHAPVHHGYAHYLQ